MAFDLRWSIIQSVGLQKHDWFESSLLCFRSKVNQRDRDRSIAKRSGRRWFDLLTFAVIMLPLKEQSSHEP